MSDYIKRDAVTDRIERHLRQQDELYPLSEEDFYTNWGLDVALDIIGNEPSADVRENKWISVNDALPPFDQKVLAFVKNKDPNGRFNPDGIYVAELKDKIPVPDPKGEKNVWGIPGYDSEWTVWSWSYFSEPCVTHWMPLPEPPADMVAPDVV